MPVRIGAAPARVRAFLARAGGALARACAPIAPLQKKVFTHRPANILPLNTYLFPSAFLFPLD